jgi:hypothetical protein
MSGRGFIAEEVAQACEMCGTVEECRPYGPNDEQVCFDCAMNKVGEDIVKKKMESYIFGDNNG